MSILYTNTEKDKYIEPSFVKDVLFLGIHRIDDIFAIYAAIMPYFNEIMNLLSLTFFKPLFGIKLFYHYTTNFYEIMVNSIVTLFSVTGIIANAASTASTYTKTKGLIVGTAFTIFSLLIPNIFMQDIIKSFKGNLVMKFFVGLILIYILDVIIHLIVYLYRVYILDPEYKKTLEDDIKDDKNIKDNKNTDGKYTLYVDKNLVY
jgi:hypothetical protein